MTTRFETKFTVHFDMLPHCEHLCTYCTLEHKFYWIKYHFSRTNRSIRTSLILWVQKTQSMIYNSMNLFFSFSLSFIPALIYITCWSGREICAIILIYSDVSSIDTALTRVRANCCWFISIYYLFIYLIYEIPLNSCRFKADLVYTWLWGEEGKINSYFLNCCYHSINFTDNWIELTSLTSLTSQTD